MIGDFLMRFRQIATRLTKFKAVMSAGWEDQKKEEPFKKIENILKLMTNLKALYLDGDPYENDSFTSRSYPLYQLPSIKSLEKLRLKHSKRSNCIKACGHMMLDLLPKMPYIKNFEIHFDK
jgi:hypothetical protein